MSKIKEIRGLICLTVICCVAIMASCDKVREQEHTKQRVAGVTNAAEHMHLP